MDKVVFSSDMIPPGLDERQRFAAWCDLYNEHVGRGDLVAAEAPFRADMAFVLTKDVVLGRVNVTVQETEHGGRRATAFDETRMGLLINTGQGPMHAFQRGREASLAPGGSVLLSRSDTGRFLIPGNRGASWIVIDLPRESIVRAAPRAEDLVGTPLVAGGEALRMISGYCGLIFKEDGFSNPLMEAHVSQTLIDLINLAAGAKNDAGVAARERGLRGARLEAIVQAIRAGYANPAFTIAAVAKRLRMSPRYIQDLLQTTGEGFSERVLELRLQHAINLLVRPGAESRKVSDIAFASGFNDLSYFHRCFRRRFGVTPAEARAS